MRNLIFLICCPLLDFTSCDRTPPYLDTRLSDNNGLWSEDDPQSLLFDTPLLFYTGYVVIWRREGPAFVRLRDRSHITAAAALRKVG